MKKCFILPLMILVLLIVRGAFAEELVIPNFPLGVGASVKKDFFDSYCSGLQAIADYAATHPNVVVMVIGTADKNHYICDHDPKNAGLALSRAHVVARLLISQFGVDSTQILVQSAEFSGKGSRFRSVIVRTELPLVPKRAVDTIYLKPRVVVREYYRNYYPRSLGLNFRAGVSSSPYGAIPFISGALVYKSRMHIEVQFGHTVWQSTGNFQKIVLDVWQRMAGGQVVYYPFRRKALGILAGWFRIEEISRDFYGYTRMSEGPVMGARWKLSNYFDLSGSYFPHKERFAESRPAVNENSFLVALSFHKYLGGE